MKYSFFYLQGETEIAFSDGTELINIDTRQINWRQHNGAPNSRGPSPPPLLKERGGGSYFIQFQRKQKSSSECLSYKISSLFIFHHYKLACSKLACFRLSEFAISEKFACWNFSDSSDDAELEVWTVDNFFFIRKFDAQTFWQLF